MIGTVRTGGKPGAMIESLRIGAASFAMTAALILFLGAGASPIG
ncbi:hypothetical protein [Sphingomonas sp. Y38-1Y]|jgi:hypothetical protein|nr:hypothetical protein [Sphingomonas sp. Y38-1Y]